MKRLALFIILPLCVAVGVSLGVVYCGDDGKECKGDTPLECNDGLCHECCIDDDCLDNAGMAECSDEYIICNDDYECECVCYQDGEDCSRDPEACCDTLACDIFTNTCMAECSSDADCTSRTGIPFSGDLKCKNGVCDFDHCSKDADCAGGKVCWNGNCVTIPDCSEITECVVLPTSAVTRQGTTAQLSATPYLQSGAVAPGMEFTWASSDDAVAAVAAGTVTGGANTGSATITATVGGCTTITCTASVTNYGDPGAGSRVVVVDELSNEPIEGATVTDGTETVTTDADGVALLAAVFDNANPGNVTVSKEDYNYVTMLGVESNDLIAHLGKLYQLNFNDDPPSHQAGGIKGAFDFGMIRCEAPLKTCDVSFGLGGLSIPGNLVNLNFDLLIGGMIKTEIELGGSKEVIPLPSGLVLCLNQTCFKEYYTPTGIPGNRVAWGLGGKLDLADLIDKLGPVISGGGGDIDIGSLVAGLLPLFANFYTAMVPNIDVVPRPMVADVNDIDDDPDTTEVPDYDNFPGQDMTLTIKMDQTMTFNAPSLPADPAGGYYYDGVIIIGGIIVRGAGLVPLGLSAGLDSLDAEDTPDGVIDDAIVMNVADVAGRIPEGQFQRVIIALAMNVAGLAGTTDTPTAIGGQVLFVDTFSGTHTLPAFLTPAKAKYIPDSGVLTVVDPGSGQDYFQAIFASQVDDKNWHVMGNFAAGDFTLPTDPDPTDPRNHGVSFIKIDLGTGDYQSLVEFNDGNMGNLVDLVANFCFLEVPECYEDADCTAPEVCDGTKCATP